MAILFNEFADTFGDFSYYSSKAEAIENQADAIAHEIIRTLNHDFITPFDREDIYLLTQEMDDVVDLIENVIHNVDLYNIQQKKTVIDDFAKLNSQAAYALGELLSQMEKQKYTPDLEKWKIRIHELEEKGDMLFQKAISRLFKEEKDPFNVIKWKDILENLENIMDTYQKVSNTIEGIVVKMG